MNTEKRIYAFYESIDDGICSAWSTDWSIARDICDNYIRNARSFRMETFMLPSSTISTPKRKPDDVLTQ